MLARGDVSGQGPFRTLADLDEKEVDVYTTEPLFKYVAAIHCLANDFILRSETADNLVPLNNSPHTKWHEALPDDEQRINWVTLKLKGSDFEEFQAERKQLGHDPDWFPSDLYRPWKVRFAYYTPNKLIAR